MIQIYYINLKEIVRTKYHRVVTSCNLKNKSDRSSNVVLIVLVKVYQIICIHGNLSPGNPVEVNNALAA